MRTINFHDCVALILMFAGLNMISPSSFAQAGPESTYVRCLKDSSLSICKFAFYSRRVGARLYLSPGSEPLPVVGEGIPVGTPCRTDWAQNRSHKGWLFCKNLSERGLWTKPEYMAARGDFRRVIGCWPIAAFTIDGPGDFAIAFESDVNGRVVYGGEFGDKPPRTSRPSDRVLYFTEDLISFGRSRGEGFVFGYDPATRTISPEPGGRVEALKLRSTENVAGCEAGMKLAPNIGR